MHNEEKHASLSKEDNDLVGTSSKNKSVVRLETLNIGAL